MNLARRHDILLNKLIGLRTLQRLLLSRQTWVWINNSVIILRRCWTLWVDITFSTIFLDGDWHPTVLEFLSAELERWRCGIQLNQAHFTWVKENSWVPEKHIPIFPYPNASDQLSSLSVLNLNWNDLQNSFNFASWINWSFAKQKFFFLLRLCWLLFNDFSKNWYQLPGIYIAGEDNLWKEVQREKVELSMKFGLMVSLFHGSRDSWTV